jgi:hypothetical protein
MIERFDAHLGPLAAILDRHFASKTYWVTKHGSPICKQKAGVGNGLVFLMQRVANAKMYSSSVL